MADAWPERSSAIPCDDPWCSSPPEPGSFPTTSLSARSTSTTIPTCYPGRKAHRHWRKGRVRILAWSRSILDFDGAVVVGAPFREASGIQAEILKA